MCHLLDKNKKKTIPKTENTNLNHALITVIIHMIFKLRHLFNLIRFRYFTSFDVVVCVSVRQTGRISAHGPMRES